MKAKFIDKYKEAGDAWTFKFLPNKPITWQAGQYTKWTINSKSENKQDKEHWFTISAPPHEKHISFTTRLTGSKYKNSLAVLNDGDEIDVDIPEGDFTFSENTTSAVFIAGGIGITPFYSILNDLSYKNRPINIHLCYANRDEDFIFHKNIELIAKQHPEFSVSYIVGMLNISVIKRAAPNLNDKTVYLSGPESMVDFISKGLLKEGLPSDHLKQDWFPGYDKTSF